MSLPENVVIQCALTPEELPRSVAQRIGCMYLKRYWPNNPALAGQKAFKEGRWKGVLAWAIDGEGHVLGWALRAGPGGSKRPQVMLFVTKRHRRKGIGDALLDCCRKFGPEGQVDYFPHDPNSTAFFEYRAEKLGKQKAGI